MANRERSAKTTSLETLLAFGFGFVFCGVLAYAGLRTEPITDPGQFFLMRVLAAISAAGVAAVIPGMLDIRIGQGKLLAIRGAGALGVFVLVFLVNPPELVQRVTESRRVAMEGNYSKGLYEDANRIADEILKYHPNDGQALNVKGGILFYRGDFDLAVEYFRKAHFSDTTSPRYTSNYANALIESKAYGAALELFKTINDGKRDRLYSLGRAHFYAGNFDDAQRILSEVPSNYWEGAARILESAALLAAARRQMDTPGRSELELRAKQKFREGYASNKDYWNGILLGTRKDKHQGYERVRDLVTPLFRDEVGLLAERASCT
jgi:tetratricopeptide (TPR) repeat protein